MTHSASLTLQGVSYQLPDGRTLFTNLHERFGPHTTGLIGRNGIGKSVLARILAGELAPSAGRVLRCGRVRYLPQLVTPQPGQTVAALARVHIVLDAQQRIENGSTRQQDFDIVGERWDLRSRFTQMLADSGLAHLHADTPASRLSGGEITRVALAGAFVDDVDFLILDEPSNHLDRHNRALLLEQLRRWSGGLIVVSHDRELLDTMQGIVELSGLGLRRYGGGYGFYAQVRQREREAAARQLDQFKAEHRREARELDRQRERLERRQSRGARDAENANLPPILLGRRKSAAEVSSGRLRARQDAAREMLSQRVRDAANKLEPAHEIVLFSPQADTSTSNRVAELDGVVLPYPEGATCSIDLNLTRGQRIGLVGANGSGKSTLIKLIAGQLEPTAGRCSVFVEAAHLDQHLAVLDPTTPVLDQLLMANPTTDEGRLRSRLALLGLDARAVAQLPGKLSGGERVRAALARVLYAESPAQLLLLDEPDNHLDLASTEALQAMLRQFSGTLIAVSHDPYFLAALKLTHRLEAGAQQWSMSALGEDDRP